MNDPAPVQERAMRRHRSRGLHRTFTLAQRALRQPPSGLSRAVNVATRRQGRRAEARSRPQPRAMPPQLSRPSAPVRRASFSSPSSRPLSAWGGSGNAHRARPLAAAPCALGPLTWAGSPPLAGSRAPRTGPRCGPAPGRPPWGIPGRLPRGACTWTTQTERGVCRAPGAPSRRAPARPAPASARSAALTGRCGSPRSARGGPWPR
mmetsp:Transcript_3923/g.13147  ORF Transcript_3923/g.13147 Transcript_3923/m.13147 type:complete len:206 (+) Transcript_3923:161-778(+)